MIKIYPQQILDALKTVRYPGTGKDLLEMNMVEDNIRIDGLNVTFSLIFDKPNDPFIRSVVKAAESRRAKAVWERVRWRPTSPWRWRNWAIR